MHEGKLTNPFQVQTGVRQDCPLSPTIFVMVVDWIIQLDVVICSTVLAHYAAKYVNLSSILIPSCCSRTGSCCWLMMRRISIFATVIPGSVFYAFPAIRSSFFYVLLLVGEEFDVVPEDTVLQLFGEGQLNASMKRSNVLLTTCTCFLHWWVFDDGERFNVFLHCPPLTIPSSRYAFAFFTFPHKSIFLLLC